MIASRINPTQIKQSRFIPRLRIFYLAEFVTANLMKLVTKNADSDQPTSDSDQVQTEN